MVTVCYLSKVLFWKCRINFSFSPRTFINCKLHLSCSTDVLIIHCVNYFHRTSFPLWEITAQSDSIEKSNIINEAWGLFSANLLPLCWLSVVSYTVIHFNGLHAWKCKTSRNGESCGEVEREPQGLLIFICFPLSFLSKLSTSFFLSMLFWFCRLSFPHFLSLFVRLIISLFLQTLSQCNKATWHLVQQIS